MKKVGFTILISLFFTPYFSQNKETIRVVKEVKEYTLDTTIVTKKVDTTRNAFNGLYILSSPIKKNAQKYSNYSIYVYFHKDSVFVIENYKHRDWLIKNQDNDSKRKERKRKKILNNTFGKSYFLETNYTYTDKYLITISGESESSVVYDQKEEQLKKLIVGDSYLTIKENSFTFTFTRGNTPGQIVIDTINNINLVETNRLYRTSSKVRFAEEKEYKYEYLEFDFSNFFPRVKYYSKNSIHETIEDSSVLKMDIISTSNNSFVLRNNNTDVAEIKMRKKSIIVTKKYTNCPIETNSFKAKNY